MVCHKSRSVVWGGRYVGLDWPCPWRSPTFGCGLQGEISASDAFGQRVSEFEKYRSRHDVREPASAVGRSLVRSEVTEMMQREWLAWVAASCPG